MKKPCLSVLTKYGLKKENDKVKCQPRRLKISAGYALNSLHPAITRDIFFAIFGAIFML